MLDPNEASAPQSGFPPADPGWALFLDVDGTLVEIAERPADVKVAPDTIAVLGNVQTTFGGALALISGRSLADIDTLTAPARFPAAGQHGVECRIDGEIVEHHASVPEAEIAHIGDLFRAAFRDQAGIIIENKGQTLSAHYRLAPDMAEAVNLLAQQHVPQDGRYEIFHGKAVLEVRPAGIDKGHAVTRFLESPPYAGRTPFYAGDDRTDEDAFTTVNRLGGVSLRIGDPPPSVSRSQARWQCADVASFVEWLASLPGSLSSTGS